MKRLIANFALILISLAVGFILFEIGYRVYLSYRLHAVYHIAPVPAEATFHGINNPPWRYDRGAGYDFASNTTYTFTVIKAGNFVVCSSQGAINQRGELSNDVIPENPSVRVVVFGDSFTAYPMGDARDPRQWPAAMRTTLEATLGRSVDVVNLGRDGYSLLQMVDLAASRIGKLSADLVVFAIIRDDLARARGWIVRRDDADFSRYFRIATPDVTKADGSRLVDTALINAAITPAWCQRMTEAIERGDKELPRADLVIRALNDQYAIITAERSKPVLMVNFWDVTVSVSLRRLLYSNAFHGLAAYKPNSIYAPNSLTSFAQDSSFMTSLAQLREAGVPFVFLHIPTVPEIASGEASLRVGQEKSLARSLVELTNRPIIDLLPHFDAPRDRVTEQTVGGQNYSDGHPNAALLRRIGEAAARALLADEQARKVLSGRTMQ